MTTGTALDLKPRTFVCAIFSSISLLKERNKVESSQPEDFLNYNLQNQYKIFIDLKIE